MDFLKENNIDITSYKRIEPQELKIRKKLEIYINDESIILYLEQKSRILQKDVGNFEEILKKVELYMDKVFEVKQIVINSPLCSKAKTKFENHGWKVIS